MSLSPAAADDGSFDQAWVRDHVEKALQLIMGTPVYSEGLEEAARQKPQMSAHAREEQVKAGIRRSLLKKLDKHLNDTYQAQDIAGAQAVEAFKAELIAHEATLLPGRGASAGAQAGDIANDRNAVRHIVSLLCASLRDVLTFRIDGWLRKHPHDDRQIVRMSVCVLLLDKILAEPDAAQGLTAPQHLAADDRVFIDTLADVAKEILESHDFSHWVNAFMAMNPGVTRDQARQQGIRHWLMKDAQREIEKAQQDERLARERAAERRPAPQAVPMPSLSECVHFDLTLKAGEVGMTPLGRLLELGRLLQLAATLD